MVATHVDNDQIKKLTEEEVKLTVLNPDEKAKPIPKMRKSNKRLVKGEFIGIHRDDGIMQYKVIAARSSGKVTMKPV